MSLMTGEKSGGGVATVQVDEEGRLVTATETTGPDGAELATEATAEEVKTAVERVAAAIADGLPLGNTQIAAYVTNQPEPAETFASAGAAAGATAPAVYLADATVSDPATRGEVINVKLEVQAVESAVDELEPDADATRIAVEEIAAKTPEPTIAGLGRSASMLTLASVIHTPNNLIPLGGTAATHRRCDVQFVGGGAVEYLPDRHVLRFSVTGADGDRSSYRLRMWCPYVPETTQRISFVVPFGPAQTNQEKRTGQFDDDNGVGILQTSAGVSLFIRSSVSGSVVETPTPIPGFDPTIEHTCQIAYQWPAGRVEFWVDGVRLLNLTMSGGAGPWMSHANLPFSVEIKNVAASAASFVDACNFKVVAEGVDKLEQTGVTVVGTATSIPTGGKLILQARVKSAFDIGTLTGLENRGVYVPDRVRVSTTNGPMVVRVYANGTVGGSPVWNPSPGDAGVEFDTAGTFAGADGLFVVDGTIDTTTGSVEIDLGEIDIRAFTATSGAFVPSETVQIVGFARSGTVSSATASLDAARLG